MAVFGLNDPEHGARKLDKPALIVPLPGRDKVRLDVLKEECHVGAQHECYGMQLRSGDAVDASLVSVHLLVGCANQLGGYEGMWVTA